MVWRPVREKSPEVLCEAAMTLADATGYDELTLSSLSISDYSCIETLTDELLAWTDERKISLSLPSLRVDSFTKELMDKISTVRTGSLTFAPEAGTQRLRDVINKNVRKEDLLRACRVAFEGGKSQVKLYFMQGLPTETNEDLDGIAELAESVIDEYYHTPGRPKKCARCDHLRRLLYSEAVHAVPVGAAVRYGDARGKATVSYGQNHGPENQIQLS